MKKKQICRVCIRIRAHVKVFKTDFAYEYEHSKIPLIFIIVRPFVFVIEFWIECPDMWPPWSLASEVSYYLF